MSQAEYQAFLARAMHPERATDGCDREGDLHKQIAEECLRRGWRTVHSRMDMPSTVQLGTCDFIIYADAGRVFNVECKVKDGKLSQEQLIFISWLEKLGHVVHVVTSFQQFLELMR